MERFVGFIRSVAYSLSGFPLLFSQNNLAFKKGLYFGSAGFRGKLYQYLADLELVFYLVGIFLVPNIFNFFLVRKIVVRLNEEKIFLSSFLYLLLKPLVNVFQASAMYIQDRRNKWN